MKENKQNEFRKLGNNQNKKTKLNERKQTFTQKLQREITIEEAFNFF